MFTSLHPKQLLGSTEVPPSRQSRGRGDSWIASESWDQPSWGLVPSPPGRVHGQLQQGVSQPGQRSCSKGGPTIELCFGQATRANLLYLCSHSLLKLLKSPSAVKPAPLTIPLWSREWVRDCLEISPPFSASLSQVKVVGCLGEGCTAPGDETWGKGKTGHTAQQIPRSAM
jgi:hypothetical protein